jgi:hypothetical protein
LIVHSQAKTIKKQLLGKIMPDSLIAKRLWLIFCLHVPAVIMHGYSYQSGVGTDIRQSARSNGGLLPADRLPQSGPLRCFPDDLPGTILISLVVPSAVNAGWQGFVGVGMCLIVYFKTKNLFLTMFGGVLTVYLLRLFG